MVLVLKLLFKEIVKADKFFYRDERISHLPLLGSPWPMAVVIAVYLFCVKIWGPWLMRNRKPFNVKSLMQAYNVLQIILNLYIFYYSFRNSYFQKNFKFSCQEYNPGDTSQANMQLRNAAYAYYISKYLDLLDTIFFVLRKKYNQITFLHVYHHSIMIYGVWVYCTLLFAALQLDIDLTPWKRRLTQLQIVQFCCLTIHFTRPILNNWCGLDMFWLWVAFVQNLFMLALFCDFYYKAYYYMNEKKRSGERRKMTAHNKQNTNANKITPEALVSFSPKSATQHDAVPCLLHARGSDALLRN